MTKSQIRRALDTPAPAEPADLPLEAPAPAALPLEAPAPAAPPVEQTAAYRDLPAHYTDWAHVRWSEGVIRLTLGQERAGAAALHAAHILALPQARQLRDILSQAIAALEGAPA